MKLSPSKSASKFFQTMLSDRRYPIILTLGLAAIGYRLVREFARHEMAYLYLEYLANYDLGFIRRGLVPEILSVFLPRLTHLDVKLFAVMLVLTAICIYAAMYRARFGLNRQTLPLFAITIASPCVFKNFAYDFARLDILGFIGATVALWLPIMPSYVPFLGAVCCLLIAIHETQFLTYVPVIVAIAAIRTLSHDESYRGSWCDFAAIAAIALTFVLVVAFGDADVPPDQFLAHLQAKAIDPIIDRIFIWYSDIGTNMRAASTAEYLWPQLYRSPLYVLFLIVHIPVLLLIKNQIQQAPSPVGWVAMAGLSAIFAGFVIIFVISHDKARWFANWISGIILIAHALHSGAKSKLHSHTLLRNKPSVGGAWLMTTMSRVGLMTP